MFRGSPNLADSATVAAVSDRTRRRQFAAVGIGNFIEWFDFAIYGYFAGIIGQVFFPPAAPGIALISSFAVFAVGFISRPLGALVFGPMGDRFGRKAVLALTISGMGVVTGLIGLLPGYATIGLAAPVLLAILRFLQGMMVGGEWSSAGIYIVESARPDRRGLAASLITTTASSAFIAGIAVAASLSWLLDDDAMMTWGWRVPFIGSVVLAGLGMYIRRQLIETPVFQAVEGRRRAQSEQAAIGGRWTNLATSFAFSSLFGVSLYYLIVYASSHLSTTVGLSRSTSLWLCGLALAISLPANSLFGSLSDRIGRRPLALAAAAALSLYAYPLFLILNTANTFLILVALTVLGILVSVAAVMNVVLLVEVFPASTRSSSAALGHNLSLAALAGPSPLIGATLVYVTGDPNAPAWYLSVVSLFCFGILWFILPETHKRDLAQG